MARAGAENKGGIATWVVLLVELGGETLGEALGRGRASSAIAT